LKKIEEYIWIMIIKGIKRMDIPKEIRDKLDSISRAISGNCAGTYFYTNKFYHNDMDKLSDLLNNYRNYDVSNRIIHINSKIEYMKNDTVLFNINIKKLNKMFGEFFYEFHSYINNPEYINESDAKAESKIEAKADVDFCDEKHMTKWTEIAPNIDNLRVENLNRTLEDIFYYIKQSESGVMKKEFCVENKADIISGILTKLGYKVEKQVNNDNVSILIISLF
jgi:hypothetical protein